jgi:hypothetical protein
MVSTRYTADQYTSLGFSFLAEDGSKVPTKEELLDIWGLNESNSSLSDEDIAHMLRNTREKL